MQMIFRIQTQYNNNKKACRLSMNDLRTTINKQNKLNRVKKKPVCDTNVFISCVY